MRIALPCLVLIPVVAACVASSGEDGVDADPAGSSCTVAVATTPTAATTPSGCAILDRDTSACDADREAAGVPAIYRHFSCRVTLTVTGDTIVAKADGQPDFLSNYYAASSPCHETYTGAIQNPNTIKAQGYALTFPLSPSSTAHTMQGTGVVGLVLNGVPIYGNFAAPGDDIYKEAKTFDRCGGHPQMSGAYHNHAEPLSVSYDDGRFIGVLRDGYAVYGRKDMDGSYPALDTMGGHTGTTPDSPSTPVFHYHVNEQTSTASTSAGETQWFLTAGMFHGTPGACTGC